MKSTYIDLAAASRLLHEGQVVAMPTETVYGLAAGLHAPSAIEALFTLKGRPASHPVIIHLADPAMLEDYARAVPAYVETLLRTFCPGPLTFILPRSIRVPDLVTGGQETVGVRFPAHPLAQALIRALGHPVAAPSANRFGRISPTCPEHVFAEFGEAIKILDGGSCEVGIESTIVDATHPDHYAILRHGSITAQALRNALKNIPQQLVTPGTLRVSGSLDKHYAPNKPAFLFDSPSALLALQHHFPTLHILAFSAQKEPTGSHHAQMPCSPTEYARVLYHELRLADASPTLAIAIERPPSRPEWVALQDRLTRACYHEPS